VQKQILISKEVNAEIIWDSTDKTILAVANLGNNQSCILDYYDSVEDAELAVEHFRQCYEIAVDEGFVLVPEFFVHQETGCKVTVAEGLAAHESVEVFRETLRIFKRGFQAAQ